MVRMRLMIGDDASELAPGDRAAKVLSLQSAFHDLLCIRPSSLRIVYGQEKNARRLCRLGDSWSSGNGVEVIVLCFTRAWQ